MQPRPVTIRPGHPLSDLLFAINHYISTGDHLGEGSVVMVPPDQVRIMILVNTTLTDDQEDFRRFAARFAELEAEFGIRLEEEGTHHHFIGYSFLISFRQVPTLIERLLERPSALGWGSLYRTIQQHLKQTPAPAAIIAQLELPLVAGKAYPKPLPAELQPWYVYTADGGHSIVVVLTPASTPIENVLDLLVPAPVKTVLRVGYQVIEGLIYANLPYDSTLGLLTEPDDDEY